MSKQAKIILFCCLYILGIITFFSEFVVPFSLIIFLILSILYYRKIYKLNYFITLLLVFFFGILNSFFNYKIQDNLTEFSNENVITQLKVLTIPSNNKPDKTSFYAKITSIKTDFGEDKQVNTKSLVTIKDNKNSTKNIKIGDKLEVKGRLKIPAYAQNPSQFDYSKYLRYKKTFSLIYTEKDWKIKEHANDIPGKCLKKLNDIRTNIINIHAKNIKSPMLEILGGIIFGDDAINPDEDTKNSFINSGIVHILAASGMNVTLIFGIWFFFAGSLKLNYKISTIIGITLILFYTCMTGFGPPIIRASLMLILILLGKLIDRNTPTMALLFIVAFIMLLINPMMIFDIGFQLSFIVTFALILTTPLLNFNFKFKPINYVIGACLIPVIAQIFAAPLQIYYFNTFALYSVFANIAIIPVLSLVSFIGFISSILAIIPLISNQVCYIADLILNPFLIYIVKVADFFSGLKNSIIYLKKPSLFQIFLYFGIIIFLILILRYKSHTKKIIISFCILSTIFALTFIQIPKNETELMFFSVGNADAIMVKSPKNEYFLIDSGKYNYYASNSQAKNIIIKYLRDKGIKNINSLILSHFDADHAGGTIDIIKYLNVNKIFLTDIYENTNLSQSILKYIEENNQNSVRVDNITKIYEEPEFIINVIKPKGENIISENQNSLIAHIKYKDFNMLFMGDGDINSYNALPDNFKKNITVLKSGHHGADKTINNDMLDNTKIIIISTGPNIYNHPHPNTINLIESKNKTYFRTDYYNAIKIIFSEKELETYSYSPKKKKFIKIIY